MSGELQKVLASSSNTFLSNIFLFYCVIEWNHCMIYNLMKYINIWHSCQKLTNISLTSYNWKIGSFIFWMSSLIMCTEWHWSLMLVETNCLDFNDILKFTVIAWLWVMLKASNVIHFYHDQYNSSNNCRILLLKSVVDNIYISDKYLG